MGALPQTNELSVSHIFLVAIKPCHHYWLMTFTLETQRTLRSASPTQLAFTIDRLAEILAFGLVECLSRFWW